MPQPSVPKHLLAARWAVGALFFTNGALYANLAPRFPEIKTALAMSDTAYGMSIAAFVAGALGFGLTAGRVIRQWGSPRVAFLSTALMAAALGGATYANTPLFFALCLLVAGAMDAITDVAQNDHGLQVQQAMGKSIINGLHATWSIGAVSGGLMAAAAIGAGVSLQHHMVFAAIAFTLITRIAVQYCLPEPRNRVDNHADSPSTDSVSSAPLTQGIPIRMVGLLLAITGITVASTVVEDLGASWASLYLGEVLGLPGQIAAFGLVAVAGAQFLGRLTGDYMVDRWGQVTMARVGGGLVAGGMALALMVPIPVFTFAGFIAAGFGVATLVPSAFHAADHLPGLMPGSGLTIVAWLMRVSFLVMPPLIGMVSDTYTLGVALGMIPVIGLLTVFLAPALRSSPAGRET